MCVLKKEKLSDLEVLGGEGGEDPRGAPRPHPPPQKRCKKELKSRKKLLEKSSFFLLPEQKVTGESSLSFMFFFFWYIELEKRWLLGEEGE